MPVRRHAAVSFLKCTLMIANNRHHHHDARREYPSRGKRVGSMVARVSNLSTSTPVRHLELHRLPFLPTAGDLHQTNVSSFPAANTGQPARASSLPDVSVFATLHSIPSAHTLTHLFGNGALITLAPKCVPAERLDPKL